MMSEHSHKNNSPADLEKDSVSRVESKDLYVIPGDKQKWLFQLAKSFLSSGVEERGTIPVTEQERTDTQFNKVFFVWFSMNFNILSFSSGSLGPIAFGLGLRDSCLVILFFNILSCALPAYLNTWGPRTGMRQMIQSRYSFGYFGVVILAILNLISLCGWNVLNGIVGGQTLASVSNGMSWNVGIVIIYVIALLISFVGYRVINWYERLLWFPVLIAFLVALGVGGKNLYNAQPAKPATAAAILSFGSVIIAFVISYSSMAADFTTYYNPTVSQTKIFWYAYLGYLVSIIPLQCLGAAAVLAVPNVPSWNEGYGSGVEHNIGGLLGAMLSPAGNFGKFLTVLLSLSVTGAIACTLYSMCFNFQVIAPAMTKVPRYVFSVVSVAITLPLSIVGAHRFYVTLTNFLSIIGYWAAVYGAVLIVEHHCFRKGDFSTYDHAIWNVPRCLPWGAAAITASILSFGLIIPCMNQLLFQGPIGIASGDIGMEVAFPLTAALYFPLRKLELKYQGTQH